MDELPLTKKEILAMSRFQLTQLEARASAEEEDELRRPKLAENELLEIEHNLLNSLSLTKMIMNASRHVNRLPLSILRQIFLTTQTEIKLSLKDLDTSRWLRLTHVCRHWRTVAHSTPEMWDHIYVHKRLSFTHNSLVRSASMPLTVHCGSRAKSLKQNVQVSFNRTPESARAMRDLCPNMNRVRELYIHSTFPIENILQHDVFSRFVLPNVSWNQSSASSSSNAVATPYLHGDIFARLFSIPYPNMSKLSLHGLSVMYMLKSSARFTGLTHLALYEQERVYDDADDKIFSLDRFLDVLEATAHSLQYLTLVRAGPQQDTSRGGSSNHRVISLPALLSLEIGEWITGGHVAYFLAHLNIPSNVNRCIWGKGLQYLSSIIFSADAETVKTKGRGWDSYIKRVVLTSVKGQDMIGIRGTTLYLQGQLEFVSIYPLFRDRPHIFDRVEELCVSPTVGTTTKDDYHLLFEVLPNVQSLTMLDMDIGVILEVLGVYSVVVDVDSTKRPGLLLPHLRNIDIQYSKHSDAQQTIKIQTRDALGKPYTTTTLSMAIGLAILAQKRTTTHKCSIEKIKLSLGARVVQGETRTDFLEILTSLLQWVKEFELVEEDLSHNAFPVEGNKSLVAGVLQGVWPTTSSEGEF